MRKILCSIQQGHLGKERIPAIEAALRRAYAEQLREDRLLVVWCEVPRGQGWTEGRLSDVSWLMVEVADGLDAARREQAMFAIARAFAEAAAVPVEKLLVTLSDRQVFGRYMAANRARLAPLRRLPYLVKTLLSIVSTRRRDGYAQIPANLGPGA